MAYYPLDKNPSGMVFVGDPGSSKLLATDTNFVYDSGQGFLGINTDNPHWHLDVSGTGAFTTIRFADGTSQSTAAAGAYTFDAAAGNETAVTINNGDVLRFSGLDGIAVTRSSQTMQFDLKDTAVTPGSYGDASTISTFTVDQQGRLTSAGETSVSITASQVSDFASQVSGVVFDANNFVDSDTFDFGVTAGTNVSGNVKFNSINQNYLTTSVAGDGLAGGNGTALSVNVDDSTIEINADTLRVKDGGITNAKLANSSVTITPGTGIGNAGAVSLGGSVTINADSATTSQVGVVQLQDSATNGTVDKAITPNAVYDISGNLQSSIDGKDNYQYWTLKGDAATTTNVDTTEQVEFNGAGGTTVALGGTDNRVVTITSTDTTYTAGSGLVLNGTTIDAQVDNSTIEINSDTFRVKDGGITNAKLANSSITLTADVGSNETVSLGDTLDIAGGSGISTTVGATDTVTVNLTATAVTAGSYGSASQVGTFTVDANGRLTAAGNTTIDITASQVSDFNSASETAIFTDANFVDSSTIDFTVSAGSSVTAAVPDSGITELKRYRTVDSSLVDTNTISKDINLVSAAGGNVLVNLPAPPISAGRLLYVKKTDSSTNTVTIDQNGSETIDGGTSYVLYNQFESVTLICDGTNWHVF